MRMRILPNSVFFVEISLFELSVPNASNEEGDQEFGTKMPMGPGLALSLFSIAQFSEGMRICVFGCAQCR